MVSPKKRNARVTDVEVTGAHIRVAGLLPDDEDEKKARSVSRLEAHTESNERLARNANRILYRLEAIQSNLVGSGVCGGAVDRDCNADAPLFTRLDDSQVDLSNAFAAIESTLDDLEGLL